MSHKWASNTWVKVSRAFQTHARRSAGLLLSSGSPHCSVHAQQPYCYKVGYLSWRHPHCRITGRKGWLCQASQLRQRFGLHTSTLYLNTSASRWSAGLSQHMSRVRNTLDTVSKAVSGTHTDLLSKIARLKLNTLKGGGKAAASVEPALKAEDSPVTPTPTPTNAAPTSTSAASEAICNSSSASSSIPTSTATFDTSASASTHPQSSPQGTATAAVLTVSELKERRLRRIVPPVKASSSRKQEELKPSLSDAESKSTTSEQTTALFHPSTFSVSLDETYNYLAQHINSYFGSNTKDKKVDNVDDSSASSLMPVSDKTVSATPVTPPLTKKGLGHYLSYSAPTVQAFVGSYIAPLVPKFRTAESKSAIVEEKKSEDVPVKQVEAIMTKDQKAADEKTKKLLLQREKIIARVSVDNRTRGLVQALHRASDVRVYINRVEDLSYHLLEFPETSGVAVKEQVIPCLLRLKQASDPGLRAAVREALALVGYHKPVKGRGIRILSIDGGGLRGLVALQTLHKLEALTGKPIYKLFDYVCGVSTGAILGFMLGVFQIPLNECDDLYRKLGSDVFKQNVIVGTVKMGWNHAFYDSEAWESILRRCHQAIGAKGGNTSNLIKHLQCRHPDLYVEYQREPSNPKGKQPIAKTIPEMYEQQRKYQPTSKEATTLNRAVAEFICLDQIPIYTVEKSGFKELVKKLNCKYELPGRNFFMYKEIPMLYTETREAVMERLSGPNKYFSCTTDLWTSRAMDAYMTITVQMITESWEMDAWCLECSEMNSDHNAENLLEALEETMEDWNMDKNKMSAVTTDNASNNIKAFSQRYTWIPCFGHNLDLATNKALAIDRVSSALSRLRKTVSAFSRSPKMSRLLLEKQTDLGLPQKKLLHDTPTRWSSGYDMVERFLDQQQAVSAALATERKKWHLMPRDTDITTLETVKEVLGPLRRFTDVLSGEKLPTISAVQVVMWEISSCLAASEDDVPLCREMKEKVLQDLNKRYADKDLQIILNCATYLDPRFKDTFVAMTPEVKERLIKDIEEQETLQHTEAEAEVEVDSPEKRPRTDMQRLLASIKTKKKGEVSATPCSPGSGDRTTNTQKIQHELDVYARMTEISGDNNPLEWWKLNSGTLPLLSQCARKYLCISASSCASERVFSTAGGICTPRRGRLDPERLDMLVFISKNLREIKKRSQ